MNERSESESTSIEGRIWLLAEGRRKPELVFAVPFDEEFKEAVKLLPGRWFDWRRKHWRVPAVPGVAKSVAALVERFPEVVPDEDVLAWMSGSERWRAAVTVTSYEGAGAFLLRTISGSPSDELKGGISTSEDRMVFPFGSDGAAGLPDLDGILMDDLARACARLLAIGDDPPPAELTIEIGDSDEPEVTLFTLWDHAPAQAYKRLPEAKTVPRNGRFFGREAATGVAVPADPALAKELTAFLEQQPAVQVDDAVIEMLEELTAEYERASGTVELSYAEDADLDRLALGGELHPFQRAGVRYALDRRRTFIADEQGLGKTIQALATLEADGAFPAGVVCPASMKLTWERESQRWLPGRSVAIVDGRSSAAWTPEVERADVVVLNYDILEAHSGRLGRRDLRALVLDESHYLKNPGARRTKAALELSERLPEDALRLALTGTPILNRAEELVAQLRVLGRLAEFGSGARLTRRFKTASSNDRLHWNLRAHCYVRRTKQQVLPQLPSKRHDTIPVPLSNESEYRLAEDDVVAWLQSLPMDLGSIDAKIAAALRAEQLVRLNSLRQLAAQGKLQTALAWIDDFLASDEPLVVFAEHIAIQRAVLERFPDAAHILGADSSRSRQAAVDAFQDPDGPQLIVCSMRAASQGITLTRASNVAFLELDWTPARHDQAEDRLHRIGQESAVNAWYLLAPNTIDETMQKLLERKRSVIDAVTDGQVQESERILDAVARELKSRPRRGERMVA